MGRPAWTPDEKICEQVEELAADGCMKDQIAVEMGINVCTFYDKQKIYPELAEAYKRGRVRSNRIIGKSMFKKARDGDTACMIFWLTNRDSDNWRNTQRQEHTGKDGGPIQTESKKVIRMIATKPDKLDAGN